MRRLTSAQQQKAKKRLQSAASRKQRAGKQLCKNIVVSSNGHGGFPVKIEGGEGDWIVLASESAANDFAKILCKYLNQGKSEGDSWVLAATQWINAGRKNEVLGAS